jgi:hypothetical protein
VFNILGYFSSLDFYLIVLILIIFGAITQSAIGIGFGIPAGILVLLEPSMVPSCIILMGSFLALSNAMLSYKDIIKVDLIYSYTGRVIGSILAMPLIFLTLGTDYYLIIFGVLLLITVFLSAKKWNVVATRKNVTIAGVCSGFMGTLTGVGGPPMAIVYQNSSSKNVVATLNMFFGIGALFSVFVLIYIDLINFREVMRCLLLAPGIIVGIVLGRQKIVKDYVNINLKKLILIICFISAIIVLVQAFI